MMDVDWLIKLGRSRADAIMRCKHGDDPEAEQMCMRTVRDAYLAGVKAFAWWNDGVETVGTCGTIFADYQQRFREEFAEAMRAK